MTAKRIERFQQTLAAAELEGAIVRQPANIYYLTGYPTGLDRPAFVVVGLEKVALVLPGPAEAVRASRSVDLAIFSYAIPGSTIDRVADVGQGSVDALRGAVEATGTRGRRVGIEEQWLTARHASVVARLTEMVALGDQLEEMRRIKDADEITQIRTAIQVNDVGFAAAARAIAPGVSELEVLTAVVDAMQNAAGRPIGLLDPTNAFVSGPRTMLAAAPATPRRLESGDLMIVDLNPFVGQYKGDATRTFAVGSYTPEQRRAHDSLVRGLENAEKVGKPGVSGCDLFAALIEPIADAGFAAGFQFHGGHALGLEHVERPYIIPGDDMPLAEGMVIALEPGIYLPGIGGVRVEDDYLVTATGLERLSQHRRDLLICPTS